MFQYAARLGEKSLEVGVIVRFTPLRGFTISSEDGIYEGETLQQGVKNKVQGIRYGKGRQRVNREPLSIA